MPWHLRTLIPSLIGLCEPPATIVVRLVRTVLRFPRVFPCLLGEHPPEVFRLPQPIAPYGGIATKTLRWPSSARFQGRYGDNAPDWPRRRAGRPFLLPLALHPSRSTPAEARSLLRLFSRTRHPRLAKQIRF